MSLKRQRATSGYLTNKKQQPNQSAMKTSIGGSNKLDPTNPGNFKKAFEQAVRQVQESHEMQR